MTDWISTVADLSSIVTAVVAVTFYVQHRRELRQQVRLLEDFLKADRLHIHNFNPGCRNAVFLMAQLGLTFDEIFQASLRSKNIIRIPVQGPSHRAEDIFFKYVDNPPGPEAPLPAPLPAAPVTPPPAGSK
jgi:hypothetical protein